MNKLKIYLSLCLSLMLCAAVSSCGRDRHSHKEKTSEDSNVESAEEEKERAPRHVNHPLEIKLYMERSGSMVSFDTDKSSGEFKRVVSTLLNRFPNVGANDSTAVYIVNDNIYPYRGSVSDFLSQRDFFGATKEIGNPSYTDFDRIFSMILGDMKAYQVSALVSDLIYSAKGQESVSAAKLLNEANTLTHNTFKDQTSNSVIVLKFTAGYNGPYYPFNSPSKGISYNGQRPFYVMLFSTGESLKELYNSTDYSAFTKFSTLPNYEDMFCFTRMQFNPDYAIVTEKSHEGRYRKDRDRSGKGICEAQLSRDGEITIPIAVDLSQVPLPESYKKNKSLYSVSSFTGYKIETIEAISSDDYEVTKALHGATHLITLESDDKPQNETVTISLDYRLPAWIAKSSTDDDTHLSADDFDSTTFGFEEMMKGIFAAYVPDGTHRSVFSIDFTVKKK